MKSDLTYISTGPNSGEYSTLPRDYKGFTIEKETEPWAIKYGNNVRFFRDEHIHGAKTVSEAMDEIDERIIDKL